LSDTIDPNEKFSPPRLQSNHQSNACVIAAPFGCLGITTEIVDGSLMLAHIRYLPASAKHRAPGNALAALVEQQCRAYFADPRAVFDLPLKPQGTAFQQRVWHAVSQLQSGERTTYGAIAAVCIRALAPSVVRAEPIIFPW
jgi:methylated-DNA-[protein]-cysteine S-methyltransferase